MFVNHIPFWLMLPHATIRVRPMCCLLNLYPFGEIFISQPIYLSKWSSQLNTFMFTSFILLCLCIFSQNMSVFLQFYSWIQHFRNISLTCYWHTFEILERTKQTFFSCIYLFFSKTWHEIFFHSDRESSLVLWERADAVNPAVVC